MAFVMCDSFQSGDVNTDLMDRWTYQSNAAYDQVITKNGTQSVSLTGSGTLRYEIVPRSGGPLFCNISFWAYFDYLQSNPGLRDMIVYYAADNDTRLQWMLDTDQKMYLTNGTDTSEKTSGTIPVDEWVHIEVRACHKDSIADGDVWIRFNGVEVLRPPAGFDTSYWGGTVNTGGFYLRGGAAAGAKMYIDSVVYWGDDDNGDGMIGQLGQLETAAVWGSGNGTASDYAGSDGNSVNNFELVAETGKHDGNTTYVESATTGQKDQYSLGSTGVSGTVHGVVGTIVAQDTVGTGNLAQLIRPGSTDQRGATHALDNASYGLHQHNWGVNPDTGSPWTAAEIEASELGSEVMA